MDDDEILPQLDVFELYHLLQENPSQPSSRDGGPVLPALGHAVAGAIASALAKTVVYPIEIVVTRLQVQKTLKSDKEAPSAASDADAEYKSLLDAAQKIYRNEGGIEPFYTGCGSDVFKGITDSFLFFLAYQFLQTYMKNKRGVKNLPVFEELGVGVIAGCFSKAITTPIQNIVTRQQTAALIAARKPTASQGHRRKASVKDIATEIKAEKGTAGFWSGYSAATILTLNPAITFAAENSLRRLIPKDRRKNPPAFLTFLLAALSKVVATSLTYPVMLAKSRAQTAGKSADEQGNSDKRALRSVFKLFEGQVKIIRSLNKIYRTEGLQGLYSGIEGEVLKGFIQHGLTMMLKDRAHGGVIAFYYAMLKITRRWPEKLEHAVKDAGVEPSKAVEQVEKAGTAVAHEASNLVKKVTEKA